MSGCMWQRREPVRRSCSCTDGRSTGGAGDTSSRNSPAATVMRPRPARLRLVGRSRRSTPRSTFAADIVALLDGEGIDGRRSSATIGAVTRRSCSRWSTPSGSSGCWRWTSSRRGRSRRFRALRHARLPLLTSYQLLLATPMLGERLLTRGPEFVRTLIRAGSITEWARLRRPSTCTPTCCAIPPGPPPAPRAIGRSADARASREPAARAMHAQRPRVAGDGRSQPDSADTAPQARSESPCRDDSVRPPLPPGRAARSSAETRS